MSLARHLLTGKRDSVRTVTFAKVTLAASGADWLVYG